MTQSARRMLGTGDAILLTILSADFFGALAGSLVHLTLVWWVLNQGVSGPVVSLLVLCIFLPLNIGVLLTGVAVARFGARRLLIASKLVATCGAVACFLLLLSQSMTLPILGCIAVITYGAMAPSVAADISRVPALTKLASRKLESFHSANGIVMVTGQMLGLLGAGYLWGMTGPATAVGIGVILVMISTAVTWWGFPRDRLRPSDANDSVLGQINTLSKSVFSSLDPSKIDLPLIFVTAAIIATAQGCIEVAYPIAVAAAGLPATALSLGYILAVITGVAAMILAGMAYSRMHLSTALLGIAILLFAMLSVSVYADGISGFAIAVGATSAAASAAGTFTVTALQERMPVSLQAQAIGLWEFLVLSSGSIIIIAMGFTTSWSLILLLLIAACSVLGTVWQRRRADNVTRLGDI